MFLTAKLIILLLLSTVLTHRELPAQEKVVLKVFELPDPRKTDAFSKADLAVVEAFKKQFPNIELRSFSGLQIENMDLDAGPLMAIAGGLNQILLALGLEKSRWIRDESLAMLCVILPTVWAGVGPGCLIYLAALKESPRRRKRPRTSTARASSGKWSTSFCSSARSP